MNRPIIIGQPEIWKIYHKGVRRMDTSEVIEYGIYILIALCMIYAFIVLAFCL